ncbi:hypothetical protein PIB30_014234 [Stylosanthes scabra]|uniref:Uncharacterized protein n=1 Tax=Stylosanthes scabra TaxID=79078 RepID=A0ABU6X5S6_9FABA|nr:hypothetical protein [Stylosanthes scabra]
MGRGGSGEHSRAPALMEIAGEAKGVAGRGGSAVVLRSKSWRECRCTVAVAASGVTRWRLAQQEAKKEGLVSWWVEEGGTLGWQMRRHDLGR